MKKQLNYQNPRKVPPLHFQMVWVVESLFHSQTECHLWISDEYFKTSHREQIFNAVIPMMPTIHQVF